MLSRSTIRLLALLLLLFSGVETLICDIASHKNQQTTSKSSAGQQSDDEDCGCTDGCLCCCAHVIPTPPFTLATLGPVVLPTAEPVLLEPESIHTPIYHPPRA